MTEHRATQHHTIGVSVEALAAAWSRRDHVPQGSIVVVDTEIAARRRLGEPWSAAADDSLSLAMILRPDIALDGQDLLWLVAALAAADAGASCSRRDLTIRWPDTIGVVGTDVAAAFVNVVTQLGPGRIEHAVVSLRFRLSRLGISASHRADLLDQAARSLDDSASLLAEDPQLLIDAVTERSDLIGSRVKVTLLPRGEARGRATALDPSGRLVLETATGMLEHVPVDGLRTIETVRTDPTGVT